MIGALTSPGEHELVVFLCQVVTILAVARSLGWLLSRVGQPAVIGELLAGLVLGPSLLGRALPEVESWLFPPDEVQGAMLYSVAWLGLLLLLGATGFESDLNIVRRLGRPAILVTIGSLLVPLAGGFITGYLAPESLWGAEATTLSFASLLAVALSISSLPVVAKVLAELGLIRRDVGQLILAVAMTNDVIGWVLLGLVTGLAHSGKVSVPDIALTSAGIAAFLVLSLTIGQVLVDRSLRAVSASRSPIASPSTVVIGIVLGAGALTQWMGVEAVLGAFIAGLVIGRSRWRDERVIRLVETIGAGILAPIFFATAGLRVDLAVFADRTVATWTVVIIAIASATKFIGAIGGAWIGGIPRREQLALGVALNARGALEIVIASVGLSIGVLNDESYGVIVIMALVTSIAAPPMLRRLLSGWAGTDDEQQRLQDEAFARGRLIASTRPPLLISRGQPPSITAASVLDLCWPTDVGATVLTNTDRDHVIPVLNVLGDRKVRLRENVPDDESLAHLVVAEADRGHGAIVVGLTDRTEGGPVSAFVEAIVTQATVPVILVRRERISGRPIPAAFARAVVPVSDSTTSRAATEVAASIASRLGTELVLAHLDPATPLPYGFVQSPSATPLGVAEPILRTSADTARASGARSVSTFARTAAAVPAELSGLVLELDADLLIIGTTQRGLVDGSSLGPIATHALASCPMTVVVVVTPRGWNGWYHV